MATNNFTVRFLSSKKPDEIFNDLLRIDQWWTGIYGEEIIGKSEQIGDVFSFSAGGGAHQSIQKLIELVPNEKIVWLVTESNLSFYKNVDEWKNTTISFDLSTDNNKTIVTFTHSGLTPKIECYGGCSNAWTQYLNNLELKVS